LGTTFRSYPLPGFIQQAFQGKIPFRDGVKASPCQCPPVGRDTRLAAELYRFHISIIAFIPFSDIRDQID